jgi:hypothetical protein
MILSTSVGGVYHLKTVYLRVGVFAGKKPQKLLAIGR